MAKRVMVSQKKANDELIKLYEDLCANCSEHLISNIVDALFGVINNILTENKEPEIAAKIGYAVWALGKHHQAVADRVVDLAQKDYDQQQKQLSGLQETKRGESLSEEEIRQRMSNMSSQYRN